MKFKKRAVLGVLLSTGLYLLDNLRERMPDNIDDIKGKARETDIDDKVSAFGEKVSDRKRKPQRATGTHGE
jgi:hypothetical protein